MQNESIHQAIGFLCLLRIPCDLRAHATLATLPLEADFKIEVVMCWISNFTKQIIAFIWQVSIAHWSSQGMLCQWREKIRTPSRRDCSRSTQREKGRMHQSRVNVEIIAPSTFSHNKCMRRAYRQQFFLCMLPVATTIRLRAWSGCQAQSSKA